MTYSVIFWGRGGERKKRGDTGCAAHRGRRDARVPLLLEKKGRTRPQKKESRVSSFADLKEKGKETNRISALTTIEAALFEA